MGEELDHSGNQFTMLFYREKKRGRIYLCYLQKVTELSDPVRIRTLALWTVLSPVPLPLEHGPRGEERITNEANLMGDLGQARERFGAP